MRTAWLAMLILKQLRSGSVFNGIRRNGIRRKQRRLNFLSLA